MSHVTRPQDPTFSSHQFIQLALDNQVLKFGEFVLKSGRISPYFFNAGLLATGEMLSLLARGYADALAEQISAANNGGNEQELVIFGAAYKAFLLSQRRRKRYGYIMASMPNGAITVKKPKLTAKAAIWSVLT